MAQRHPSLYITTSEIHGRGVFAAEQIEVGEIIEICPVIVLPAEQRNLIHQSNLHDYYFLWGEDEQDCGIVLGYGSIYNHSYEPNAEYIPDYETNTLTVFCYKTIEIGNEITLNYNGDPNNKTPLWFNKKELK